MLKINDFNRKSFSVISNGKVASTKPIIKMMKCMQDAIEDGGCIVDIIKIAKLGPRPVTLVMSALFTN